MSDADARASDSFAGGFAPREWIAKAQGDLDVAEREASRGHGCNRDAVAFHCQQAIEKLMKAALVTNNVPPPKVHDLADLLRRVNASGLTWSWPLTELRTLSTAAVHARYPGYEVSPDDAADVLRITRAIWRSLRPLV